MYLTHPDTRTGAPDKYLSTLPTGMALFAGGGETGALVWINFTEPVQVS